jgi:NTE family protein
VTIENQSIGLALSGGGFRATLFGLGSLWRLNETGLLGKLDYISSVSGGSILSGILARRWKELDFVNGRAGNFQQVMAEPVQDFCSRTIDVDAAIFGMLTPFKTAGEYLADRYDKELFHGTLLRDIPAAEPGRSPEFIFQATNLQTGCSFSFRQDRVTDAVLGVARKAEFTLADAVAASSAFPPIFSPVILQCAPSAWQLDDSSLLEMHKRIVLADGGVSDSMGVEPLVEGVDILLASDAGIHLKIVPRPLEDDILQFRRIRDILTGQARALRKRWLTGELAAGRKQGAYWGIDSEISEFQATGALTVDNVKTARLHTLSTRTCRFDERDQGRLINWGYALAAAALGCRSDLAGGAELAWPLPDWHLS